jgi:putative transport protein
MIQILIDNPLLLLFAVVALGYPLGRIKIGGSSLGIAAVLFVGIAVGALDPNLKLPEIVYQLGLLLFVYTVGLSSGPGFFASLRNKGIRDNLLVIGILLVAAGLAILSFNLFHLKATLAVGMFAGSMTNTPALAAVLEAIKGTTGVAKPLMDQMLAEPVVGYSIAYPMGVVGMILTIYGLQRFWKIDYAKEAERLHEPGAIKMHLHNHTIKVTRPEAVGKTIQELLGLKKWDVIFGRVQQNSNLALATGRTQLTDGMLVSVVGTLEEVNAVENYLGERVSTKLESDRSELDYRRIFVSNSKVAGHTLKELNLPQQFGAVITRVRRGDSEFLPHGDTVLELGDRVRVVTRTERMDAVSNFLGDSYRALSEINILSFSLGLALGLLVGLIPIPLPGGITIKLGMAGGPLVVALLLGTFERTGPLVWTLPYNANLTLRQIGLVLFLAAVGTRAGYPFVSTFTQGGGIYIFLSGIVITCVAAFLTLWIGYKLFKIPMGVLIGMLAGLQTQPALLGYALEQTDNDLPNIGYATVYPIATITKILLAQLLLSLLL